MNFDLVPSIKDFEAGESISAEFLANFDKEFEYELSDGRKVLNPAIVSEVVGQLLSLLVFETSKYTKQALFFGVDQVSYNNIVKSGSKLEVRVCIERLEDDFLVSRAKVFADGKLALETTTGKSILLPLTDYRDVDTSMRMFKNKLSCDSEREKTNSREKLYQLEWVEKSSNYLKSKVKFNDKHWIFKDHFPRKKIIPGVSLMTVVGEHAQFLDIRRDDSGLSKISLLPVTVENLKFKRELSPSSELELLIQLVEDGEEYLLTKQLISCEGKKVSHSFMKFKKLKFES